MYILSCILQENKNILCVIFAWSVNCSIKHFPQGQSMQIFDNLSSGPSQENVPNFILLCSYSPLYYPFNAWCNLVGHR